MQGRTDVTENEAKNQARGKTPFATAVQEQPKAAASPLERLLAIADNQPNPHDALGMFQSALDQCEHVAKVSFDNADVRLWDIPHARCYLRAVFGVATSLWQLNRIEEAATQFEEAHDRPGEVVIRRCAYVAKPSLVTIASSHPANR